MPRTPVTTTGFFGKIPATGDFVNWNLPRAFTDRWDRWMSRGLIELPSRGPLDPRAWRFTVPAGIFCDVPAAGVWRMSEDKAGRHYPLVIARLAAGADPAEPWFDEVDGILAAAVEGRRLVGSIADRISRLPDCRAAALAERIIFWLDDWEVQELHFKDIHDLAATGLPRMRAVRRMAASI